jgi:hypothetical protein
MKADPHALLWSVMEKAHGSEVKMRPLFEAMSRDELIEVWRDFHVLSSELFQPPWVKSRSDYQDEITWWVVMQGKAYYEDVFEHPEKFPEEQGEGDDFRGVISRVYFERFHEELGQDD